MYHLERCRGAVAARSCGQRGQQAVVVAARPPRLAALVATGSSFAPTTTALATSECRRLHPIRRHRSRVPLLRSIRVDAAPTAPTRALHAAARRSLHAAAQPQHTTTPPPNTPPNTKSREQPARAVVPQPRAPVGADAGGPHAAARHDGCARGEVFFGPSLAMRSAPPAAPRPNIALHG